MLHLVTFVNFLPHSLTAVTRKLAMENLNTQLNQIYSKDIFTFWHNVKTYVLHL